MRMCRIASRLEAIASRLEAIASRFEDVSQISFSTCPWNCGFGLFLDWHIAKPFKASISHSTIHVTCHMLALGPDLLAGSVQSCLIVFVVSNTALTGLV